MVIFHGQLTALPIVPGKPWTFPRWATTSGFRTCPWPQVTGHVFGEELQQTQKMEVLVEV